MWSECCGPFVDGGQLAPSCEQLMRSRYSAFATGNADHLWRTWHPTTRPVEIGDLRDARWVKLDVLARTGGDPASDAGTVDFVAHFFTADDVRGEVREHARFAKRAGRWFYVDGDELAG